MAWKLNRRDLLKSVGASSTLSFIPSWAYSQGGGNNGSSRPPKKLRAVMRIQMYAGWDVRMSLDPPGKKSI